MIMVPARRAGLAGVGVRVQVRAIVGLKIGLGLQLALNISRF